MKHILVPSLALLAACSAVPSSEYDIQSLESSLESGLVQPIPETEQHIPGFVSLFEQQPDGSWTLKPDPALVP